MTRFARAKGSKAANERLPEDATSWQEMKQQLSQSQEQTKSKENAKSTKSSFKMDKVEEKKEKAQWSDFPNLTPKANKRKNGENDNFEVSKPKKLKSGKKANKAKEAAGATKAVKVKKVKKAVEPALESVDKSSNSMEAIGEKKTKKREKKMNGEARNDGNRNKLSEDSNQQTEKVVTKKFDKRNGSQGFHKGKFTTQSKFSKSQNQNNYQNHNNKPIKKKERNFDYKRRKPEVNMLFINGVKIEVMLYEGFPIKREDYERLKQLKQDMINKGIPHTEINKALKLERRRAEKVLTKAKKSVCFNCRKGGHNISECPNLQDGNNPEMAGTGICFKCGSTQHTHFQCKVVHNDDFKFAQCFICKERGHISRQCPDNNRGIYPKGGACKLCGDVTHLKMNCPTRQIEQEQSKIVLDRIGDNVEGLDNEPAPVVVTKARKLPKIIKFA